VIAMPFESRAQWKAMFAKAGRGEIDPGKVREWAKKTKKKLGKDWTKKLPERKSEKK
jgi:hypothetical protein